MIAALALVLLLAQGAPAPEKPTTENRAPVPVVPAPMKDPTFADVDRTFALAAMQGNNAEMDMARLALQRTGADEIKGYAAKMIAEHGALMADMMPALRRTLRAPAPPQRLAPPDALAYRHLQGVGAVDFDQAYAMQQIGDHLATMTAFQTEADNGTDPQLKALARKWLPSIQSHLELAIDLTNHIGGSSPFKQH